MAKPKCSRCGSEDVAWAKTKAGKWMLVEPRPHIAYCKARPKREAQGPKADAVLALVDLGYKKAEALALVAKAKGKTGEEIVRAVLAGLDALPAVAAASTDNKHESPG